MAVSDGDWVAWEQELAALLAAGTASANRQLLLARLGAYAEATVRTARAEGAIGPTAPALQQALSWLDQPVFICGFHRSGTTLLQSLLDGHPELRVLPSEGTYLTSFAAAARAEVASATVDHFACEWICRLIDPNQEPHFKLGRSEPDHNPYLLLVRRLLGWHQELRAAWPQRAPFALLLALVAALPGREPPRLWVEKTPLNERHAQQLAATFPAARFIHLVRDPKAVLNSFFTLRRASDLNHHRVALAWRLGHSLRLARRNRHRFGDRYLVVRYEDLALNLTREMERVRATLGISSQPSLAIPTVQGQPVGANSALVAGVPGVVSPPRAITASALESELVAAFAAAPARRLGYDQASLPLWLWPRFLLREISHSARVVVTRRRCAF